MYLPVSTLVSIVLGAYLIGLITIPIIALIILKNPSRMHATARSSSKYSNKRNSRKQRRW